MSKREFYFPARQSGVVLFIALIVLVAMTMAGLALIRSSNTGLLTAGNLTFKQGSVSSGDRAIQAALTWMAGEPLVDDVAASGYYASATHTDETTWAEWDDPAKHRSLPEDAAGNSIDVVIHRMCETDGPVSLTQCTTMKPGGSCGGSGTSGSLNSGTLSCPVQPVYRVTAKITGPKGTVSYVQAMVLK